MTSFILMTLAKLHTLVSLQSFLVGLVATLSVLLFCRSKSVKNRVPGPFTIPMFGSIFVLPSLFHPYRRHQLRCDLASKYGRIYQFQIGKAKAIFLNDMDLLKEAFITKGEIISDRLEANRNDDIAVMFGAGKGIGASNYSKDFKERKTLALHSMKDFGFGGKSLEETAMEETVFLNNRFKEVADAATPTDLHQKLIHLAVSNVICSVVFGRRFDYNDDKFNTAVDGIKFLFSQRSSLISGIPLVSRLPAVQKKLAVELQQARNVLSFIEEQIQLHKEEFDPNYPKDFIDLCLQKEQLDQESAEKSRIGADNIKKIIIDMFFAGTDTTAASLSWFMLYMIRFPDIQRKCQREIDEVLETQGDLSNLNTTRCFPYTTATLLETQRISSIAGSSLPHVVRENTTLGGFDVEKGSMVFANIRFLHLDERYWKNPEVFDPERWLDPSDRTKVIEHTNFIPFSIGKRRCLGLNLAKAEYSMFAISLLRSLSLKMVDPLQPPPLEGSGNVYSPTPFKILMEWRREVE